MGELEVFGFYTFGWIEVKNAVGNRFTLIRDSFNVSIPYEDCEINSLKVVKGKEKGSAFYDVVLFNATGKLSIIATDMIYFSYQLLEENTTAIMHFDSPQVRSFLIESGYPSTDVLFTLEEKASESVSISVLERNCEIFLGFGADNGSLVISGSQNFSLPLMEDRAGILLEVSIPINRAYTTQVNGELDQLYLDDWETIGYVFLRGLSHNNYFVAMRPNGEFSYDGERKQVLGSQDLNFTGLTGVVYIMPSSNPNLFRVLIGGDVSSILSESSGRKRNLTEKSYLDILFPFPIFGLSLLVGALIWYWIPRRDAILIPSIIVFFLGSLIWAIKTEQPLWIQNFFSYTPLFVSVIVYLTEQRQRKDEENKQYVSKTNTKVENEVKESNNVKKEKKNDNTGNIEELVKLVDENFSKKSYEWRLTLKRLLVGVMPNIVVIVIVVWLFFIVFGVAFSYLAIAEFKDAVVIMISITALTIALFNYIYKLGSDLGSLFGEVSKEKVTDWNFKRLKENVKKEDIQLLKALIMMKCKQPDFPLKDIYETDKSLFKKENLLRSLYE